MVISNYRYEYVLNKDEGHKDDILYACYYTRENIGELMTFIEKVSGKQVFEVLFYDVGRNEYWFLKKNESTLLSMSSVLVYNPVSKLFSVFPKITFSMYYRKVEIKQYFKLTNGNIISELKNDRWVQMNYLADEIMIEKLKADKNVDLLDLRGD